MSNFKLFITWLQGEYAKAKILYNTTKNKRALQEATVLDKVLDQMQKLLDRYGQAEHKLEEVLWHYLANQAIHINLGSTHQATIDEQIIDKLLDKYDEVYP